MMSFPFRFNSRILSGIVLASAAFVFAGNRAAAVPLYTDGFEAGTGFVVESGNAGFGGGEGRTEGSSALVYNGGQTAANAVVSRTFATTTGQQYLVEFDYGNFNTNVNTLQQVQAEVRDGSSSASGTQLINDGSGQITTTSGATLTNDSSAHVIRVADSTGGPGLTTPAPNATFSAISYTFTAASANSTLVFRDQAAGGADSTDGILDNVRITVVPEPTGLAIIGIGLAVSLRRRRAR